MDETLHSSSSATSAAVAKYTVNLVYCTGLEINLLILRSDLQFLFIRSSGSLGCHWFDSMAEHFSNSLANVRKNAVKVR